MESPEMVSMERTPAEQKADEPQVAEKPKGPLYPWGLKITLGKEELKKLQCDELPDVGDEFHIMAVGEVTSVRNSSFDYGDGRTEDKSVEIQITHLGLVYEEESTEEHAHETTADENREQQSIAGKVYKSYKASERS